MIIKMPRKCVDLEIYVGCVGKKVAKTLPRFTLLLHTLKLPTLSPPTTQSLDGTKGHFLIEGASANRKMAWRINFLLSWLRRSEKMFCMGTYDTHMMHIRSQAGRLHPIYRPSWVLTHTLDHLVSGACTACTRVPVVWEAAEQPWNPITGWLWGRLHGSRTGSLEEVKAA